MTPIEPELIAWLAEFVELPAGYPAAEPLAADDPRRRAVAARLAARLADGTDGEVSDVAPDGEYFQAARAA